MDFCNHEEAIKLQVNSDLLILPFFGRREDDSWVPAKLYEYLGSGTPVLAFLYDGEAQVILRRSGAGYVVNPDNLDEAVNRIEAVFKDFMGNNRVNISPDKEYIKTFTRRRKAEEFLNLLNRTMK